MHNLGDILVIAVCCMLCGGESFYDMEDFGLAKEAWFRTFPDLPNGIPSHDTFNRVFAALAPAKFNACFLKWTEGLAHAGRQAARASPSSSTRGRPPTGSCSGRSGWRQKQRDHGGPRTARRPASQGLHRHARRHGLPEKRRLPRSSGPGPTTSSP